MALITANQRGISAADDSESLREQRRGYNGMVRAGLALNDESGKLRTHTLAHAHARDRNRAKRRKSEDSSGPIIYENRRGRTLPIKSTMKWPIMLATRSRRHI